MLDGGQGEQVRRARVAVTLPAERPPQYQDVDEQRAFCVATSYAALYPALVLPHKRKVLLGPPFGLEELHVALRVAQRPPPLSSGYGQAEYEEVTLVLDRGSVEVQQVQRYEARAPPP